MEELLRNDRREPEEFPSAVATADIGRTVMAGWLTSGEEGFLSQPEQVFLGDQARDIRRRGWRSIAKPLAAWLAWYTPSFPRC
jgi:hypothetical protein